MEIARAASECALSLQVNTTLTRHNVGELETMAQWVRQMQAKMWSLFFLVPVGRGKHLPLFSPQEHEAIFERLYALKEKFGMAIKTTEAPHFRRFVLQQKKEGGVTESGMRAGMRDGSGVVFVSRTGDICPSGFLPLKAGNVIQNSLREVYSGSELFQSLRRPSEFKGKCGQCDFRFLCGGSRARAYAATGDPLESDPFCAYVPIKP
jgi:radical SAM protein with 4Fe4S-binding SPASM domain